MKTDQQLQQEAMSGLEWPFQQDAAAHVVRHLVGATGVSDNIGIKLPTDIKKNAAQGFESKDPGVRIVAHESLVEYR
jgi:hypothetical protein